MKHTFLYYKGKRPNNSKNILRNELLSYLKEESKKNHIPSRREIEKKFHLQLDTGIELLYKEAGLEYQLSPNQEIKSMKANLLLRLIIKNLNKFGLKLIEYRSVHKRGIDIITERNNKKIGIEIKAYNRHEKLKQRDIKQLLRFNHKEKLEKAIIVTTTNIGDKHLTHPNNIKLLKYNQLKNMFSYKEIKELGYIRNHSVNVINTKKDAKRKRILEYVLDKYLSENKKPTYNDISKELHLHVYTYFDNLFEIYKILKIPPPLKNMDGKGSKTPDKECINLWKEAFKINISEEIKSCKNYPSDIR